MPFFDQLTRYISLTNRGKGNRTQTQTNRELANEKIKETMSVKISPSDSGSSYKTNSNDTSSTSSVIKEVKKHKADTQKAALSSHSASSNESAANMTLHSENSSCHYIVEKILETVGELESNLVEDHQQEFKLRAALERKTEQARALSCSLEAERKRNQRLMQLIHCTDNGSASDNDNEHEMLNRYTGIGGLVGSMEYAMSSTSPLLMQQRYDELNTSYEQCRRQLAKKEKLLMQSKCEKEAAQAKYDALFDSFRSLQKSFEDMCSKYLRLQARKHAQIEMLKDAVNCAGDVILIAQNILKSCDCTDHKTAKDFKSKLKLFLKSLRKCDWIKHNFSSTDESTVAS